MGAMTAGFKRFLSPRLKRVATLVVFSLALLGSASVTLLSGQSARAETSSPALSINTSQTFYVYAEAGETLDIDFDMVNNATDNATFTVIGPGNVIHSANGNPTPNQPCTITAGTPIPATCEWTGLTAGTAGVWSIQYTTVDDGNSQRFNWSITARDGGTPVNGRVYTEAFRIAQTGVNDIELWYKSQDGFLYNVRHLGYDGIVSTLRGDPTGVRESGTCISGYRNAGSWNAAQYSVSNIGECGDPFKIFFNNPDTSMPVTATLPNGSTTWIDPQPVLPAISNLAFTGDSIVIRSGNINFDVANFTGNMEVQIDTNNNGMFTDPVDVALPAFALDGSGNVHFNGMDGQNNPVPPTQAIRVRPLITQSGELHFSSFDVETRTGGIEVEVLNGTSPGFLNVYWNDSLDPNAATQCANSGGGNFSTTGLLSQNGVHTWNLPTSDCTGQWGNNKTVDDWTYVPTNVSQTLAVPGLGESVHYRKTVSPVVSTIPTGQVFNYTVAVENTGDLPLTGLSFTDDLSDVIDDATYNNDVNATIGLASFNAPDQIIWNGNLGIGQTAIITYSVTMNDPATGNGQLRNNVVSTGSNSNCTGTAPIDPDCFTITPLPDISTQKTYLGPPNPEAGDTVNYQFTITNNGVAAISGLAVADDLSGVLDDAAYNGDAIASTGMVGFNSATRRVVWNGNLAATGNPGDSATITLSVTINGAGNLSDAILNNALIAPDCPNPPIFDTGNPNYAANCVTSTQVSAWMARKAMSPTNNIHPGSTVNYMVQIENTGAVNLTGLTVDDDLSDVIDDAIYNNNASATMGTPAYAAPELSWTGNLAVGQIATLTYSIIVDQEEGLANRSLANAILGSQNCPGSAIFDPSDPSYNADCAVLGQITMPADSPGVSDLAETGQNMRFYIALALLLLAGSTGIILRGRFLGRKHA